MADSKNRSKDSREAMNLPSPQARGSQQPEGTRASPTSRWGPFHWRTLLVAALIVVPAGAAVAGLLLLPRFLAHQPEPATTPTVQASVSLATSTLTPLPTWTPVPPTPTPTILYPTISGASAEVDDEAASITFHLEAQVPPDQSIEEVVLWYDTETGHQLHRTMGPLEATVSLSYRLDAALEGMTRTITTTQDLDYWWLVRDTAGDSVRAGGTAHLGPALLAMVSPPTTEAVPVDYTWAVSDTLHYRFHYKPDSAADRDRFLIGAMAEAALDRITAKLEMNLDQQMRLYLIPRVFWQGGAAYGDKVQLISYLDRNYTGVETWTYFTHEGTHALAQDLLQPKEDGGGPDGVLVEGLAVWASNGHYRLEPIDAWSAVIAGSDEYLPLGDLRAGPFYDFQHETSYIEAASFVRFLVDGYGLDKLKELYGRATGDAEHDEALATELYGQGYAVLDAEWLAYLEGLSPTEQQAETWHLKVRSFDLMRRYETELDPDARILPSTTPPDWETDMFQIFWQRADAPVNLALETALIAAQERLYGGNPAGAQQLLDDVEAALDAGGALERPSLRARQEILELLSVQDRAILLADADAYLNTLASDGALAWRSRELLRTPFTAYRQEMVRLDIADDGLSAEGAVLVHAEVIAGEYIGNGRLYAVTFVRTAASDGGWRMASRRQTSAASLSGTGSLPEP